MGTILCFEGFKCQQYCSISANFSSSQASCFSNIPQSPTPHPTYIALYQPTSHPPKSYISVISLPHPHPQPTLSTSWILGRWRLYCVLRGSSPSNIHRLLYDIFCIIPYINPRLPYQPEGLRADMGRGMIWGMIWKMSYHNLFIIYFLLLPFHLMTINSQLCLQD